MSLYTSRTVQLSKGTGCGQIGRLVDSLLRSGRKGSSIPLAGRRWSDRPSHFAFGGGRGASDFPGGVSDFPGGVSDFPRGASSISGLSNRRCGVVLIGGLPRRPATGRWSRGPRTAGDASFAPRLVHVGRAGGGHGMLLGQIHC
jgi:hypothetical protein